MMPKCALLLAVVCAAATLHTTPAWTFPEPERLAYAEGGFLRRLLPPLEIRPEVQMDVYMPPVNLQVPGADVAGVAIAVALLLIMLRK